MTDPSGSYTYAYGALGNLVTEEKTIEGIVYTSQYAYDAAATLTAMTYPDGRSVTYSLDGAGRVSAISTTKDSVTTTVAQDLGYLPFGPFYTMSYGNGTPVTKTYDQLYRLTGLDAGSLQTLTTSWIPQPTSRGSPTIWMPPATRALAMTMPAGSPVQPVSMAFGYTYEKGGNRLTRTQDGQTDSYCYETGTVRVIQEGAPKQGINQGLSLFRKWELSGDLRDHGRKR